jgi:hypothetical protein
LDASGGSVFRNLLGAAKGALIRAAASTQSFGILFMDAATQKRRTLFMLGLFLKICAILDHLFFHCGVCGNGYNNPHTGWLEI